MGKEEDVVMAARGKHTLPARKLRERRERIDAGKANSERPWRAIYLASEKHGIHHLLFWLTRYKSCLRSISSQNF